MPHPRRPEKPTSGPRSLGQDMIPAFRRLPHTGPRWTRLDRVGEVRREEPRKNAQIPEATQPKGRKCGEIGLSQSVPQEPQPWCWPGRGVNNCSPTESRTFLVQTYNATKSVAS